MILYFFTPHKIEEIMKTILITGGTGYIGSWTVKYLLEDGYCVRLTVRNKANNEKYKFLQDIAEHSKGSLEIWEADLLKLGSFDAAAKGADWLFHMASPFTLKFNDPQKELIDPALIGTENVLSAATKSKTISKVILTSSVAAVHGDNADMVAQGLKEFDESHWNTTSSLHHQPYSYSKTLAEHKAWEMSGNQTKWKLVVINPSFVIGPTLVKSSKSGSLDFMNDILSGKFKTGAPELYFGFVDVRDVAKAHILAAEDENAEGRHILAERTMSVMDMVQIIERNYPKRYKLPKMKAPKFLLYLIGGLFGITPKFVKQNVGHPLNLNATKSKTALGLEYYPIQNSIVDMIESI